MSAAMAETSFDSWLSKKLLLLNPDTDLEVFVQYITSILETEDDPEEQNESLMDLLGQITEDDLENQCAEIIGKYGNIVRAKAEEESKGANNLEAQFVSALEKRKVEVKTDAKPITKDDIERMKAKEAILMQFSQVSSGEENDEDGGERDPESLAANVNSKLVIQRQVAEREKSKQDHDKKKQKDKEDREKQKQKATDRKEAEKKRTQKGERKR